MVPTFDYVSVLGATSCAVRILRLVGISTLHTDTHTDQGRLYANASDAGAGTQLVRLYSDPDQANLVANGTSAALGQPFNLAAANGSGITGRAAVTSFTAGDAGLVVIPTFATDLDVMLDATGAADLPGFDPTYGLAVLQAQAVRRILTADLPAMLPMLYGASGLAGLVPTRASDLMPDLSRLANADQLRVAQGDLVKYLSAKQQQHTPEYKEIMDAAWVAYRISMDQLAKANIRETETEKQEMADEDGGPSFGGYVARG